MNALIGEDRPLYAADAPQAIPSPSRDSKQIDDLLNKLLECAQCDITGYEPESKVLNSSYYVPLTSLLWERKRELTVPFVSFESAKLAEQARALEKSTEDCMSSIEGIEKDMQQQPVREIDQFLKQAYKQLPENIDVVKQEVYAHQCDIVHLLRRHQQFRPISLDDFADAQKAIQLKQMFWENQIRNDFCNFALLSSTYFLRRQKRRNFPKKATRILNQYFEGHMDEPYPDESTKQKLADLCGVTIGQISNWFGNKRIRFKKSLERQDSLHSV